MELNLEEQTLVATFRGLDDPGKKDLLRYASMQHKIQAAATLEINTILTGQCRIARGEERPETISEPIFTE